MEEAVRDDVKDEKDQEGLFGEDPRNHFGNDYHGKLPHGYIHGSRRVSTVRPDPKSVSVRWDLSRLILDEDRKLRRVLECQRLLSSS